MAKLRLDEAPAANLPLRFLLAMPCWAVIGGVLLLIEGSEVLRARWQPSTLALVHVWTLGVLGNAMFGSLLQFLPVAGSTVVRWPRGAPWLHAVFNLGVAALVIGLQAHMTGGLMVAGILLPAAFTWLGLMVAPGLVASAGDRLLRAGLGAAVGYGIVTALFGALLAFALGLRGDWWPRVVDAHASFGVLGWMLLLLAAVARLTMPMFQATRVVPARAQGGWLLAVASALPVAAALHVAGMAGFALAAVVAAGGAAFALVALALQWPVPRARRTLLYRQWRLGLAALALAALALAAGQGMLAGVLAFAVGLPVMVGAMAMEIVPFVAWIELRRRIPRGTRVPGVQRLAEDAPKHRVLVAHTIAAPLLIAAACWPQPWLVRAAALAQIAAWGLHAATLAGVLRAQRRFLRVQPAAE